MVAVAVKVVLCPLHKIAPALEVMLMAGATLPPTVTVMALDVTVAVEGQVAFDVR